MTHPPPSPEWEAPAPVAAGARAEAVHLAGDCIPIITIETAAGKARRPILRLKLGSVVEAA